jgi:Zinc finger, C2H2 type
LLVALLFWWPEFKRFSCILILKQYHMPIEERFEQRRWACSGCRLDFDTRNQRDTHNRKTHRQTATIKGRSGEVYKIFRTKNGGWKCPCKSCDATFGRPDAVGDHIRKERCWSLKERTHRHTAKITGQSGEVYLISRAEDGWKCPDKRCDASFSNQYLLQRHIREDRCRRRKQRCKSDKNSRLQKKGEGWVNSVGCEAEFSKPDTTRRWICDGSTMERSREIPISNIHFDLRDPRSADSDEHSSTTIDEYNYPESSQFGNFL